MNKRVRQLVNSLDALVTPELAQRAGSVPASSAKVPGLSVRMADESTAEILIYGRIGGGWFEDGMTASHLAEVLAGINAPNIHVRINSGGGDVFEGVAIHTQLRRHAATVTTFVDGLAASAASFIAQAGDRIVIARGAMMMIHNGMTGTYGNKESHARTIETLGKVDATIADLYAARAGEDAEHWSALMTVNGEDGTWFTAEEAVEAGLADEMTDADEDAPATADTALRQWSAVLERAPERVRALLNDSQEQSGDFYEEDEPLDEVKRAFDEAEEQGVTAPPETVDHSDDDPVDNADADFRFRMQMWQWQQDQKISRTAA